MFFLSKFKLMIALTNISIFFTLVSLPINTILFFADLELKELFIRFLKISLGSVKECIVCITIAKNQTFITEKEYQKMRKELTEISKMLNSLIKYLRTSTND